MNRFFNVKFDWLAEHWKGLVSALIVATIAVLTLSLQLTSLVPGQNQFETETLNTLSSFPKPWDGPVNAPYLMPTYLLGNTTDSLLHAGRLVSVIYGLLATACLFYVLKKWFNIRMATVGSLLFITSSWLLHIAHVATPLILMIFAPLAALAAFSWLIRTKKHKLWAIFAFAASVAFALYVPYMIWILLVTITVLVVQGKERLKAIEPWQWLAGGALFGVLVLPLLVGVVREPSAIKVLWGIPDALPSLVTYIKNMGNLVLTPFFRSPLLPELHLGRLPLMDIFSTTMFILGLYYFAQRRTNRRTLILFFSFLILIIILPLSSRYQLNATILMPLIYICVISGIVELLKQWYSYFPRNPLARSIGVGLVVVAIGFTSFYHLQRYFIAWPNTPDTKNVYVVQLTEKN